MDLTLTILKPDCVTKNLTGKVIDFIESHGFEIITLKKFTLTKGQTEHFYSVHKHKPFYPGLLNFMTSGPCIPMVLRKENAVEEFRKIIGNTDPEKAEEGTLRQLYAENIERNIVHGSDSQKNAKIEIAFFFPFIDII